MLTNMEWGAVAYLTHSKYGSCEESNCTEIAINSNSGYKTGCGPQSLGSISNGTTCNVYKSTLGITASTTGNIYGIYDMNGGAYENVMGNMSSASEHYTYYTSNGGGSEFNYNGNEKYITTYAYGTSYINQTAYNRGRLGDATSEVVTEEEGWFDDRAYFLYNSSPWFRRGGNFDSDITGGVFFFGRFNGCDEYTTSRAALVVFP